MFILPKDVYFYRSAFFFLFFQLVLVLLTMNMVKIYRQDHDLSDSQNMNRVTVFISAASTAHRTKAKTASPLIQKSPHYTLEIKECS